MQLTFIRLQSTTGPAHGGTTSRCHSVSHSPITLTQENTMLYEIIDHWFLLALFLGIATGFVIRRHTLKVFKEGILLGFDQAKKMAKVPPRAGQNRQNNQRK